MIAVNAEIKTTTLRKERGGYIIHSDDNVATVELLLAFTNAELDCEYEALDVMYLFDERQGVTPRNLPVWKGFS